MPNHGHRVLGPRADGDRTAWLRWLTQTPTLRWHARHRTAGTGHLDPGGFKAFPVPSHEHLLAVARSVARNALGAGRVGRAEPWRWGRLGRRCGGAAGAASGLDAGPLEVPGDWVGRGQPGGDPGGVGGAMMPFPGSWNLPFASGPWATRTWPMVLVGLMAMVGGCVALGPGHTAYVIAVAFAPDGKTLASSGCDSSVRLWDPATGALRRIIKLEEKSSPALVFGPRGKVLAGGIGGAVRLWDPGTGQKRADLKSASYEYVLDVAFAPDGKRIAAGNRDTTVTLWNVDTGMALLTLTGHTGPITGVAFSPDGRTVAASSTGQVILWDATTGAVRTIFRDPEGVDAIAYSPDGAWLAASDTGGPITLWDVAAKKVHTLLKGHRASVSALAFSPNGAVLASGSSDATIKLWDMGSGVNRATLRGHQGYVNSIAFSPDGQVLASGSDDHTVRLWDLATLKVKSVLGRATGE